MNEREAFGATLRHHRRAAKRSMIDTGKILGWPPSWVADLEHGRSGSLNADQKAILEDFYDLPSGELSKIPLTV